MNVLFKKNSNMPSGRLYSYAYFRSNFPLKTKNDCAETRLTNCVFMSKK